ncbi:AraC family transcriptional regulator [Thalassotalea sp. LPB0316]|uniref:helix-turn-helix domain-containing protein n=1 Tax=Thalassotalea sp. LPB0316 TaxID=2769490 RepID=UPI0018677CDC|nr:helix-turn-helix domain-containing protein [Thalassotalea sp. LPB0316]QOL26831.1 AraC family transcriptional regulator [Thalassotalea sp. LPB0316]
MPFWRTNHSIRLFIILMLSGSGYLLGTIFTPVEKYSTVFWISHIGGNALPGVFWLVSLSVFGDHNQLKRWQYIAASMTLVVPLFIALIESTKLVVVADYPAIYGLTRYGGLLFELVLVCHALITAAHYWRDDLVKERRYLRGSVIGLSAFYIFVVIVVEQLFDTQWHGVFLIKSISLFALIAGINFFLFQLNPRSLFETQKPSERVETEKPSTAVSKELTAILQVMEQDKLYQQEGLTITSLAKHLGMHEYKLRNLINGELGYRNFNDFLNYYRIREVTHYLIEPEHLSTPVLTLALESGFRSLSSFNKAFKAQHGLTPTEYRKKNS